MARSKEQSADLQKARVLVACALGKPNDVVVVTPEQALAHAAEIDTDKAAVAYAEQLQGGK